MTMKAEILRETLERSGLNALPEVELHSATPWGYRNRTQLRVSSADGATRVGYNRRGTNEFLPIGECPILAPLLWRAAEALVQLAAEDSAAARLLLGAVEVELFTDADEKKLQMTVFVQKIQNGFDEFCEHVKEMVPELVGAGASLVSTQRRCTKSPSRRELGSRGAQLSGSGRELLGQPRRLLSGKSISSG